MIEDKMHKAASRGRTSAFKTLHTKSDQSIDINHAQRLTNASGTHDGSTFLCTAAALGNCDLVSYLVLQPGIDLEKDQPLWWAARNGRSQVIEVLLAQPKINVNKIYSGRTPLGIASSLGHTTTVEILLQHAGVDINRNHDGLGENDDDGMTPLIDATVSRNTDTFNVLLSHPAVDVNAVDLKGRSALILAAQKSTIEKVRHLLDHKDINPSIVDECDGDALYYAKERGFTDAVTAINEYLVHLSSTDKAIRRKQKTKKRKETERRQKQALCRWRVTQLVEQADWEGLDEFIAVSRPPPERRLRLVDDSEEGNSNNSKRRLRLDDDSEQDKSNNAKRAKTQGRL
jgi:ankyrin repeat protein